MSKNTTNKTQINREIPYQLLSLLIGIIVSLYDFSGNIYGVCPHFLS